jgi:hypothetical protein
MKKNNIVLWIAAFVITFLTIYLSNLLDNDYPLSGTFGIDGKKFHTDLKRVIMVMMILILLYELM